jgi:hypothetical protein
LLLLLLARPLRLPPLLLPLPQQLCTPMSYTSTPLPTPQLLSSCPALMKPPTHLPCRCHCPPAAPWHWTFCSPARPRQQQPRRQLLGSCWGAACCTSRASPHGPPAASGRTAR